MDAAVAALLGAAIGAVASLGGAWIQTQHQTKRDRLKMAADLGLADHKGDVERAAKSLGGAEVPPLSAYVMYHAEFLDCLAKGTVTPEQVAELNKRQDQLLKVFPKPSR